MYQLIGNLHESTRLNSAHSIRPTNEFVAQLQNIKICQRNLTRESFADICTIYISNRYARDMHSYPTFNNIIHLHVKFKTL